MTSAWVLAAVAVLAAAPCDPGEDFAILMVDGGGQRELFARVVGLGLAWQSSGRMVGEEPLQRFFDFPPGWEVEYRLGDGGVMEVCWDQPGWVQR